MKRIMLLAAIILLATTSIALEDTTPAQPNLITGEGTVIDPNTLSLAQAAAGISRLEKTVGELVTKSNDFFTKADMETIQTELDEQFERKVGDILAKMTLLLLMHDIFFFAVFFLLIAKGWFGSFGKTKTELKKEVTNDGFRTWEKEARPGNGENLRGERQTAIRERKPQQSTTGINGETENKWAF